MARITSKLSSKFSARKEDELAPRSTFPNTFNDNLAPKDLHLKLNIQGIDNNAYPESGSRKDRPLVANKKSRWRLGKGEDLEKIKHSPIMEKDSLCDESGAFVNPPLTGRNTVRVMPKEVPPPTPRGIHIASSEDDIRDFFQKETKLSMKQFRTRKIIGRGTFGTVQVATYGTKKVVDGYLRLPPFAIKSMRKDVLVDKGQIEHVRDEFNILKSSSSPYIVKFYGFFQDAYSLHFIQEYIIGGELFNQIALSGGEGLPIDHCRFYFAEIACAIADLHARKIVYRDLKPENILINNEGHLKLIDFGFAKDLSNLPDNTTYTLCGTPEYLAPEILNMNTEKKCGHSFPADTWALGVLLFELITGATPFKDAETPIEMYKMILQHKVTFPKGFDDLAQNLVSRLLRKDCKMRLESPGRPRIRDHKFLSDHFEWSDVQALKLTPPWKPMTNGPLDSNNFQTYAHIEEDLVKVSKENQDIFAKFDQGI